jgi:hypothetical protein
VTYPVGLARQYWNRWAKPREGKNPPQGEEKKRVEGVILQQVNQHRRKATIPSFLSFVSSILPTEWLRTVDLDLLSSGSVTSSTLGAGSSVPQFPLSLPPGDHPHSLTVWAPATAVPFDHFDLDRLWALRSCEFSSSTQPIYQSIHSSYPSFPAPPFHLQQNPAPPRLPIT